MSSKKIGPNIDLYNYLDYRWCRQQDCSHFKWVKLMAELLGITLSMLLFLQKTVVVHQTITG